MRRATDIDQLKALFDKAGIVYRHNDTLEDEWYEGATAVVTLETLTGKRNQGYGGFFANFAFDDAGTLLNVGIWK